MTKQEARALIDQGVRQYDDGEITVVSLNVIIHEALEGLYDTAINTGYKEAEAAYFADEEDDEDEYEIEFFDEGFPPETP